MAEQDPGMLTAAQNGTATAPAPRRRWGRLALMLSLPIALIIGGLVYWQSLQGQVSTDNA